ncbi:hypothetical protein ES711_14765 [Gelidibacter salicanalis]|uniref:Uncharacterized protein n=1 Tax=Gelidibacter salicanalis TaxID=291193 RepID=A0A5C7AD73_9FLAO|nr:hypothetical protein [Gelidibacter salicanalis]TXE05824.1 hypothetical protein ES711_14765 [Gelidibacter salicanalis]
MENTNKRFESCWWKTPTRAKYPDKGGENSLEGERLVGGKHQQGPEKTCWWKTPTRAWKTSVKVKDLLVGNTNKGLSELRKQESLKVGTASKQKILTSNEVRIFLFWNLRFRRN